MSTIVTPTEQTRISIGRPALRAFLTGEVEAGATDVVVRRPTLRDAQRTRSLLRSGSRDLANYSVALEVEVAVAPHPASARASVLEHGESAFTDGDGQTVRYIGTPHGLTGLIRDIYAAEVADAVILVPIDGSASATRIREQVLPEVEGFADVRVA